MSQPFTFPPPPPPPPKRDQPTHSSGFSYAPPSRAAPGNRGTSRGRFHSRGYRPGGRSHGLRQGFGRGVSTGAGSSFSKEHGSNPNNEQGSSRDNAYNITAALSPPFKRDHGSAFGTQVQRASRPKAPPAVPSFNADIDSLLKPSTQPAASERRSVPKKTNLLGLTPSHQDPQSESDSASEGGDDEARLAHLHAGTGNELTFEHRGQTLSLRTPEEIAAWVAERRKKFPTQAKAEAAKKEAEEKKRRWEEQRKVRDEALQQKKAERDAQRHAQEKQKVKDKLLAQVTARAKAAVAANKSSTADEARRKAEKLRKKAERAARELREAEEALEKAQSHMAQDDEGTAVEDMEMMAATRSAYISSGPAAMIDETNRRLDSGSSSDSDLNDSDDSSVEGTSSSGSSDSDSDIDSDSAPEEESSRRTGPERVLPSKLPANGKADDRSMCRNFVKYGKCKFGKKCRYSHDRPARDSRHKARQSGVSVERKGLYQIMVEKEQEEEHKQVLRAIISLGDQGLLD